MTTDDQAVCSPRRRSWEILATTAITLLSTEEDSDLLLSGFAMQEMNGGKVAAQAIKIRPEPPVFFMTGLANTMYSQFLDELEPRMDRFEYKSKDRKTEPSHYSRVWSASRLQYLLE